MIINRYPPKSSLTRHRFAATLASRLICPGIPMPAKKKAKTNNKMPDFEHAMEELESLVEAMESGDLTLEQSMQHFERGIKLTQSCQKALSDAEQKIKLLVKGAGGEKLTDFDID